MFPMLTCPKRQVVPENSDTAQLTIVHGFYFISQQNDA